MDQDIADLSVMYGEVVAKKSYGWVNKKLEQAKLKKLGEEQSLVYQEIINELSQENLELENIARQYKNAYEQVTISDEDIDYLHSTLMQALKVIENFNSDVRQNREALELMVGLINKDTLKTMQMLGFNYKSAIGEPLTNVCSDAIYKLTKSQGPKKQSTKKR